MSATASARAGPYTVAVIAMKSRLPVALLFAVLAKTQPANERDPTLRNRYAGKCFRCGADVPSGKGYFQRMLGRWVVRCMACVGKGNEPEKQS